MHPLRNGSQATVRPAAKPLTGTPGWFTESGDNNVPSYPGADWFNHVIAEFQNALAEMGVEFDPQNEDHLAKAFKYVQDHQNESDELIESHIVDGGHQASQITRGESNVHENLLTLERKTVPFITRVIARSYKAASFAQGVVNIGDSISHGAYSGNHYTNSWTALITKSLNHQFGSRNLGIIPMDSVYNSDPTKLTNMLHEVIWAGNWGTRSTNPYPYDYPLGRQGSLSPESVNGKTCTSSEVGASVSIKTFVMQGIINLFYRKQVGGGAMSITINGVAAGTLDTAATTDSFNNVHNLAITDDGKGTCTVVLTKLDNNPTEIQAIIGYRDKSYAADKQLELMNFCNYSQSGRQLRHMSKTAIIKATNAACMIMSLGYNDAAACENDDFYYAEFVQRIDWLIQYINVQNTPLIVQDFCWYWPATSRARTQLKRLADETYGRYIDYPARFYPNGDLPVLPPTGSSELVTPLGLFADNAHPNNKGNELIFQALAVEMGLEITSKIGALNNDMEFPISLNADYKNTAPHISTVKRTDRGYILKLAISRVDGTALPSTNTEIASGVDSRFKFEGTVHQQTEVLSILGEAIKSYGIISGALSVVYAQTGNAISFRHTVTLSKLD